jgi:hypothetical protein
LPWGDALTEPLAWFTWVPFLDVLLENEYFLEHDAFDFALVV